MLADVRETAGEPVAEERLDCRRERRLPHRALRGDDEHAPAADAAQLGIELFAHASGAPMDHFRVCVMESRHGVLAPPGGVI